MSIVFCKAITKKGSVCKNKCCKTNNNSDYCKMHSRIFKFEKPSECPICQEDISSEKQPLSCGHWVHKNCILSWKDQCPVCRKQIKLTKKEQKILINRNARKSNIQNEEDDYVDIFDYINNNPNLRDNINFLSALIVLDAYHNVYQTLTNS